MLAKFVEDLVNCVGIPEVPAITDPGLPNFAVGCFMGTMAGITYILDFIPPTPQKILNLKLPTIDLFITPFLSPIKLPDGPGIDFGFMQLPGRGKYAELPAIKFGYPVPDGFDASGIVKLIFAVVMTIFKVFTGIVESVIKLSPQIPGIGFVLDIMKEVGAQLGIDAMIIVKFGTCFAKAFIGLIKGITGL